MDMPDYTSQTVFALFYAIMWGALANVWPRWRAFDWVAIDEGRLAIRRGLLSLLWLNGLPIIFFICVFLVLRDWKLAGSWWSIGPKLLCIMLQPFALIGFYWVWVSIIKCRRAHYYPSDLSKDHYRNLREIDLDPKNAKPVFWVGILYIVVPVVVLILASYISR